MLYFYKIGFLMKTHQKANFHQKCGDFFLANTSAVCLLLFLLSLCVCVSVSPVAECHILKLEDVDRCDNVRSYLDPCEPDVLSLRVQSKDTRLRSNFLIRKVRVTLT